MNNSTNTGLMSTRVLTQDEIDSLLGFDDDEWFLERKRHKEELQLREECEQVKESWDRYCEAVVLRELFIKIASKKEVKPEPAKKKKHCRYLGKRLINKLKEKIMASPEVLNELKTKYPELSILENKIKRLEEDYKVLLALTRY